MQVDLLLCRVEFRDLSWKQKARNLDALAVSLVLSLVLIA